MPHHGGQWLPHPGHRGLAHTHAVAAAFGNLYEYPEVSVQLGCLPQLCPSHPLSLGARGPSSTRPHWSSG